MTHTRMIELLTIAHDCLHPHAPFDRTAIRVAEDGVIAVLQAVSRSDYAAIDRLEAAIANLRSFAETRHHTPATMARRYIGLQLDALREFEDRAALRAAAPAPAIVFLQGRRESTAQLGDFATGDPVIILENAHNAREIDVVGAVVKVGRHMVEVEYLAEELVDDELDYVKVTVAFLPRYLLPATESNLDWLASQLEARAAKVRAKMCGLAPAIAKGGR